MDQSKVAPTARELLERHLAEIDGEIDQPNQNTPENVTQEPAKAAEIEQPHEPEVYRQPGYAQGTGGYVSETEAAAKNDKMINRAYHEHERSAEKNLEQHIEKSPEAAVQLEAQPEAQPEQGEQLSAREALELHMAGREVTAPHIDPFSRGDRSRQRSGYER